MTQTETPAITLDAAGLPLAEYRAMREGRAMPTPIDTTSSAADAAVNADAETAVATDATETNSKEEPSTDSKPAKSDKLNARFSELTSKIRTLESQLAAKSGAVRTDATPEPKVETPAAAAAADPEPAADKFTDYVEWQKSWMKWQMRQEAREVKAAAAVAEQQNAAKAKAETWQSRVSEASAELADFATVAQNPELPVTQVMAEAITDSEAGPRILYHLGKNPAEAARIAKLSPVAAIREIGKIEAALTAAEVAAAADSDNEETLEAPPTKKPVVSKAPAPHKPLGGGASSTNPAKQIDSMTQAEYRAYRESGKLR